MITVVFNVYTVIVARDALIGVIYFNLTEALVICVPPIMFIMSCNENNYFSKCVTLLNQKCIMMWVFELLRVFTWK